MSRYFEDGIAGVTLGSSASLDFTRAPRAPYYRESVVGRNLSRHHRCVREPPGDSFAQALRGRAQRS